MPKISPKASKMTSKASKMISKASKMMSKVSQMRSKGSQMRSMNPEFRGRRQGAKPFRYSPHPLQGELGVLNLGSESAESEASGRPRPCRRPLPKVTQKCPKIDQFSDLEKTAKKRCSKAQKWLQWRASGLHWDLLWGHLNDIFEDLGHQIDSMGCSAVFLLFLGASRSGQCEE